MANTATYTAVITLTEETKNSFKSLTEAVRKFEDAFEGLTAEYDVEYRKGKNNDK